MNVKIYEIMYVRDDNITIELIKASRVELQERSTD